MSENAAEVRRKRLLFRCHHTGMKENDLLIGSFADRNLPAMSDADVEWLEWLVTSQDDIDLNYWITGRKDIPPELEHPVMRALIAFKYVA